MMVAKKKIPRWEISRNHIYNTTKNYILICVGLAFFALGWTAFLIPSQLTGGGVSGIATILYFATNVIPVGLSTLVINLFLILIAWKILGPKFSINSIICTVVLSFFFSVGQAIFTERLVDDTFLNAIIGSVLAGFGVGMALNYGGNTGGTDIIVLMISKYRNISYGRLTMYINVIIVASSYLVLQSVELLVYSMVIMFAYTFFADMFIDGYRQTFQILVFSSKNQEIADKINVEMKRGATFLKGKGAYSKEEKDILLVVVHRTDRVDIIRIIKKIDNSAFITITKITSVFGKNFDELKL